MKKQITAIVLCIVLVFASMLCGCESTNEQIEKVYPNIWVNLIRVNGGTETVVHAWEFNSDFYDSYRGGPIICTVPIGNYYCQSSEVYYYKNDKDGKKIKISFAEKGAGITLSRQIDDWSFSALNGYSVAKGPGVYCFDISVGSEKRYDYFYATVYLVIEEYSGK